MFNFDLQRFANIKTVKDGAVVEGLPPATSSTKGGIMVGTGLSVDSQGKISVPTATTTSNGLMTSAEKTKLSGIATDAEANVINTVKVNNSTLTVSDKAVNIDLTGYVQKDGSKVLSTNDYTTADKNKLAGIATGAEVNKINIVKVNGTSLTPDSNKAVDITVPDISNKVDKVSGKGLSTNDYTTAEKNKLSGIATGAEVNKIETIKVNGTALTPDSNRVVEITTTSVDISNKVDKVEGKGLSTNDYTTEEKNKLAGIASNANNYSLPNATTTTKGGVIVGTGLSVNSSGTVSVATATTGTIGGIKLGNGVTTTTGGVVSIQSATASQNGLMTSTQASKLEGIATGAEVNAINTVKVNNTALSVSSKAVNIDLTNYVKQNSSSTFLGIKVQGDVSVENQNIVFTGGTDNESIIFGDGSAIDASDYTGNAATATKLKTGRTLKVNLNSTSASTAFNGTADIANIGVAGTLPVANGGTGAATAADARTKLGLKTLSTLDSVALGSNVTGTLGTANGGTGTNNLANVTVGKASSLATPQSIVASLGSSVAASFNGSSAVTVGTQGTLPINKGGTGLTSSPSMLTNLGSTIAANVLAASPRPGVTGTLPISNGGTGATTAANARASLGLGAVATQNTLAVANGGTGTNSLANITVGAATKDGSGNTITSTYAPKASPTFTGEVTAPIIKGLDELQFHYYVNNASTGAFTFTGIKVISDRGTLGKSMMVTAGQALILGSGEVVSNVMRLDGTADSVPGLTTEYITGENTAIISDNQISFFTNVENRSATKQWIFGTDGETTMPGRVRSNRFQLSGGWFGIPANDPITTSYTTGSSTSTTVIPNNGNVILQGANRLFIVAGEGGLNKFAKYSDKLTCRDYTLETNVPIWIMPQGSAIDLAELDSTNDSEHMFLVADRSIYIYTNLQKSSDIDDNSSLTEVNNMPHKFMFTYTGQFQAPVVHCGKLLLTDALSTDYGGTGLTESPSMLVDLGSTTATSIFKANPRPGVTGTLPVANGGTGATSVADARTALGLKALSTLSSVALGSNVTGTLPVANGGTGATVLSAITVGKANTLTTPRSIVASLGSSVAASFDGSANVTVGTQGTLPVNKGGTGLTSSPSMLTNLGSTTAAGIFAASPRPGVTGTLPIANGGTGATSESAARTKLGLGTISTLNSINLGSNVTGTLPVANGGTGATSAATARTNLGLKTLSTLDSVNLGSQVTGTLGIANGGTGATSAATARTQLGLGTAATTAASIYPSLASNNTFSGTNTFNKRVYVNERVIMMPTGGLAASSVSTNTWASAKDNAGTSYTPSGGIAWYWASGSATGIFGFSKDGVNNQAHNILITTGEQIVLSAGEVGGLDVLCKANTANSIFKQQFDTKGRIHMVAEYGMEFITGAASTPKYFYFASTGAASIPGPLTLDEPLSIANGGTGATSVADARTALDVPQASEFNMCWYAAVPTGSVNNATKKLTIAAQGGNEFKLKNGVILIVYFSEDGTSSTVSTGTKFSINGGTAISVDYWDTKGTVIPNNTWSKGIYMFVYAVSNWRLMSGGVRVTPNNITA